MARHFCPRCGLSLDDGEAQACPRCGVVFAAADPARANFDEASGAALGSEPVALRCWHCGEPIDRTALVCASCGTDLTRRGSAAERYSVVASSPAPAREPAVTAAPADVPPQARAAYDAAGTPEPGFEAVGRPGNYFARHWRGDLPLAVSFWVNIFLVTFGLNIVLLLVQRAIVWTDSAMILFAVGCGIWFLRIVVLVWQFGGAWRAAGASIRRRKRAHRTYVAAVLARAWIVILVLGVLTALGTVGITNVRENFTIAFLEDPEIPPYAIEVVPDGSAVLLTGGIRFGIAGDLRAVLDANPGITTVYLQSEGGRMGPGGALFQLIRSRGLDTYAIGGCYSACTLAFAGGSRRMVGRDGELGFHSPSFGGDESYGLEQDLIVDMFQPYRDAGFSDSIIFRARATPPDDMWFPTDAILLNGNVLTEPRDSVGRPDNVPVPTYVRSVAAALAPYLPLPLWDGLTIESIATEGDIVTMVATFDATKPRPADGPSAEWQTALMCATVGNISGATFVLVTRNPTGEAVERSEFAASACGGD